MVQDLLNQIQFDNPRVPEPPTEPTPRQDSTNDNDNTQSANPETDVGESYEELVIKRRTKRLRLDENNNNTLANSINESTTQPTPSGT